MLPLDGYTVIDLSVGIAGAYCTKLLADGGAEVIKVEPPEGDPLRLWSASGAEIKAGDDGALFSFLACSKHSVVVDPANADDVSLLRDLLTTADAVVWSRGSAIVALDEFSPAALADAHAHLTVTSITPFGLEGPWADKPATEFTVQAWSGGVIGLGRGAQDRAPLFVAGQIGEWLAGAFAAAGTMAVQSGLVDVSMLEAQILCLTYYSVSFNDALGRPFRDRRRLTIPGVATAADGLVALGCGTAQQWFDLCAMVGHEEWIDEESELSITEQANIHAEQIYEWVRENSVDDILDLSTAFRIPNAPVGQRRQRHIVRPIRRTRYVRLQSPRWVHAAGTALPHDSVVGACTATGSPARRAHRPLPLASEKPGSRIAAIYDRECYFAGGPPAC